MNEICPVCQNMRKSGSLFCEKCGHSFDEKHCPQCGGIIAPEAVFCSQCGYKFAKEGEPVQAEEAPVNLPPVPKPETQMVPQQEQNIQYYVPNNPYQPVPNKPGKNFRGLIIGIVAAAAVLLIAVVVIMVLRNKSPKVPVSAGQKTEIVKKEPAPPVYSYEAPTVIHPALYQSTDFIVYFKGSSEAEKEMLLTVEIPGFIQKYEQKITLKPQELKMKIRPPLVEGVLSTLNTSKEAQIIVTLQDIATQKYLIQDSKPVTLLSKYDMQWANGDGSETYYEDICAWVTPEDPIIKELLRNSIEQLSQWSGGAINAVVGYQAIGGLQDYEVTYYQVAAIFETLRSYYNVRYNATPVTTSGNGAQQRIALPKDVIVQQSGLCIETAVTMASAIEATGMHPMILILPGHAQVAFESWQGSGEYYLLETTALTETDWNNIIVYLTKDQWTNYLANNQAVVVDVELARKDGIKPME